MFGLLVVPSGLSTAPSLSVVVPAFNERQRLPVTLSTSLEYLREQRRTWELIVVDDGSDDGTAAWTAAQQPDEARLRVIRSPTNCGKGAALAAGVRYATGERVLFMDADGGTPLTALPALEAVMDAGGSGVVIGARQMAKRRGLRRLMGDVFSALAATCASGVSDTQCGFKLLSRSAASATMPHLRIRRWAYDVELLYLAQRLGIAVASAPVPATDVAGSKIAWHTPAQMLVDVLRVSVLYRVGVWRLPRSSEGQAGLEFAEVERGGV